MFKKLLPSLLPIVGLGITAVSAPMQSMVTGFVATHPLGAAGLGALWLVVNHWIPSPAGAPTSDAVRRAAGSGFTTLAVLALCALVCLGIVGCTVTPTEVVQQAVIAFQTSKGFVDTAKSLVPELETVNPQLAKEVGEYADLAGVNLDNLITAGNAYLAKPSGDKYQNILNGVDALTASVDAKVLAAAKISNPQSQQRVLAVLTVASVSAHAVLTILQARASRAQLKAVPVVSARVTLDQVKPYMQLDYARGEIAKQGYDANEVFSLAGL